jgi:hypothetical protein
MRNTIKFPMVCALMFLPVISFAADRFDGNWKLPSVVSNSNFRGEHGTAGEPGYLLLEGKIAADGSAKLAANGIVASRKYARGVLAHKGEEYGYDVKAQFKEAEGTGARNEGLGIVGRACTFEFVKQQAAGQAAGQ